MDYHQADILDSFEWSMRHDGDLSSKLASGKVKELTVWWITTLAMRALSLTLPLADQTSGANLEFGYV